MKNENTCIFCGKSIPEGRQVCPDCVAENTIESKKCPYCHPDSEDYVKANGAFWIYEGRHEGWLIHAGKCKPQPINYCPMCGRRLESYGRRKEH